MLAYPENRRTMRLGARVECYAGYRGEETPRCLNLDRRGITVETAARSYRILGSDPLRKRNDGTRDKIFNYHSC